METRQKEGKKNGKMRGRENLALLHLLCAGLKRGTYWMQFVSWLSATTITSHYRTVGCCCLGRYASWAIIITSLETVIGNDAKTLVKVDDSSGASKQRNKYFGTLWRTQCFTYVIAAPHLCIYLFLLQSVTIMTKGRAQQYFARDHLSISFNFD